MGSDLKMTRHLCNFEEEGTWDVHGPNIPCWPCLRPLPLLSVCVCHILHTQVEVHSAEVTSLFDFLLLCFLIELAA